MLLAPLRAGVAVSHDGIEWLRGDGLVEGHRGAEQAGDVGVVLQPNSENWWTHDTCHLAVSDVQVRLPGILATLACIRVHTVHCSKRQRSAFAHTRSKCCLPISAG